MIVLHIPHASRVVPQEVRGRIVLSDAALHRELVAMTDSYTDELFAPFASDDNDTTAVTFGVSRLVVDVERFVDDAVEPMASRGMGVLYTTTSDGALLRYPSSKSERHALLARYYVPHHEALRQAVDLAIDVSGRCLVVDCHSFPSVPRRYELDPMTDRPDICIGTDTFHTPEWLAVAAQKTCERLGLSVARNRPYAGALVPANHYGVERRVSALMLEVSRRLYMDEETGEKHAGFDQTASNVLRLLAEIAAVFRTGGAT